jgi:phosphatidylserine decarboxylase
MNQIIVFIQKLLPHHALSRLMQAITRIRLPLFKDIFIRTFIRLYKVDMSEAVQPDPSHYPHFNGFFTRELRPEARPIINKAGTIACPVDGTVSQAGPIQNGQIFQAKGFDYSLTSLLGGAADIAGLFNHGSFATLYLSPRDYHRIHMPLSGQLQETIYVPGRLFSVNRRTTQNLPDLFARNERLVTLFDTEAGPMALVLVGALFVSGIETVWNGMITRPHSRPQRQRFRQGIDTPVTLERGQEMGRFNMGSTVIALFDQHVNIAHSLQPDTPVQMGQLLGHLAPPPQSNQ